MRRRRSSVEDKIARWTRSTERLARELVASQPAGAARERAAWFAELLACVVLVVEQGADMLDGGHR
jgi:hypothetical protein